MRQPESARAEPSTRSGRWAAQTFRWQENSPGWMALVRADASGRSSRDDRGNRVGRGELAAPTRHDTERHPASRTQVAADRLLQGSGSNVVIALQITIE